MRDVETSKRALCADDVAMEESGSDGPGSIVHGCAGWVHRCSYKRQVEGDRAAANERGRKLRSPVQSAHTSMHMHVDIEHGVAANSDVSASSTD